MDTYRSFPQEPVVDELGEDARLLWIGPKRLNTVILYCHGMLIFDLVLAFGAHNVRRWRVSFCAYAAGFSLLQSRPERA